MRNGVGFERIAFDNERMDPTVRRRHNTKLFDTVGGLSYENEDIDREIVQKLLAYPNELQVISDWIQTPDGRLAPKLWEVKATLGGLIRPPSCGLLYRGFTPDRWYKSTRQDTMGVVANNRPGDQLRYHPFRPLSFSWVQGTAEEYGDVVVSTSCDKYMDRLLFITSEMMEAIFILFDGAGFESGDLRPTQAETILLPNGQDLEFVVIKNKNLR